MDGTLSANALGKTQDKCVSATKKKVCRGIKYEDNRGYVNNIKLTAFIVNRTDMSVMNSLVPARFLVLIAHLEMVITIFWSRGNNVRSCLPLEFTEEQYTTEDNRLIIALSVSLCLFAIELFGFFSGTSMFNSNQGVLSMACHCGGSVSLAFFVTEQWECWVYWIIFAFCSVIPALSELVLIVSVFGLKKKPM